MDNQTLEMVPPQALEAEQSTLGSMMIDGKALSLGVNLLSAADFYRPAHQAVFRALSDLQARNEPVDLITMQEELREKNQLEDVGGTEYLMTLVDTVPTAANVEHYARIVKAKSELRQIIAVGTEIIGQAYNESQDSEELRDNYIDKLRSIGLSSSGGSLVPATKVFEIWYQDLSDIEHGRQTHRSPFGLSEINRSFRGGAEPGDLIVIGADTSHGKSIMIANMLRAAMHTKEPVALYTCEMTKEAYLQRILCAEMRMETDDLTKPGIDFDRIASVRAKLNDWQFDLCDTPPTMKQFVNECGEWCREHVRDGRGIVAIDYANLMPKKGSLSDENNETARLFREFKQFAMRWKVKAVTASQVRKAPNASREPADIDVWQLGLGKVPFPKLADLYGSQEISGSADKCIILFNPPDDSRNDAEGKRPAYAHLAKNRNGTTGRKLAMWFHSKYQRFDDCDWRYEPTPGEIESGPRTNPFER